MPTDSSRTPRAGGVPVKGFFGDGRGPHLGYVPEPVGATAEDPRAPTHLTPGVLTVHENYSDNEFRRVNDGELKFIARPSTATPSKRNPGRR